ncbi:alpha/beta hydrolase fold domain-containing protein [Halomonas coralii]|nr:MULTISPECIES: alpha/beta hydrolase fold domain-containing protein [unclassified Modicisalibacter]MBZ9557555.1 alpha/beta hydrolase fold domain-containing protein [Modicisalibacter sp. R2A 31.J]MBZ9573780.1 alpha/beta hydrolase fold domain-containing protein [Modicisalibacter sp. MOD 31.J]
MTVDDFIRRFEQGLREVGAADDMLTARRRYEALCRSFAPQDPAGLVWEDDQVDGVGVRRYRPDAATAGIVLYLHGGGWNLGSIHSHHGIAADLARRLGHVVVSVDYRLAPEADYGQALDDCHAVVEGIRPVALIGDSAGARLGLDLARRLGWQRPLGLIYPPVGTPDAETLGPDAPLLARDELLASWRAIADDVPALCEAHPPAMRIEALAVEHDPLTRPFEAAIEHWRAQGAEIRYHRAPDMVHGALHAHAQLAAMNRAWAAFCEGLREALVATGSR